MTAPKDNNEEIVACLRCGKWYARGQAIHRKWGCRCGGWIVSRSRAQSQVKNRKFMAGARA